MKAYINCDEYNSYKLFIDFYDEKPILKTKEYVLGDKITMEVIYQLLSTSEHSLLKSVNGIVLKNITNNTNIINLNDIHIQVKWSHITLDKCVLYKLKYNNSDQSLCIKNCKIDILEINRPLYVLRLDDSYISTITSPYSVYNLYVSYYGLGKESIDYMDIPYIKNYFISGGRCLINKLYGYIHKGDKSSIYLYSMDVGDYCIGGYYGSISRLGVSAIHYLSIVII